jgi:uncharacterized protein (TIGR03083 family)
VSESLPADVREITAAQIEVVRELVAALSDADLTAPTACAGWLAAHLLVHVRLGLAEATGSFAEPAAADEPADRDFVSYWRDWPTAAEPVTFASVRWHWANASNYSVASEFRRHFTDTASAAAGVSLRAPAGRFRFQGHVMAAEDILAMWTVEFVVHQLDLIAYLPGRPVPLPAALALTAVTLDELTGGTARPPAWDDITYALKGSGRVALDDADLEFLGERAAAFPAFG